MKPDKRKNAKVKRGNVFYIEWIHSDYLEYWLRDFTADGSLLHICCGDSGLGYPRADINPDSNRTMYADLFKLLETFKENQFDYVYIDPPFNAYTSGDNRFRWQFDALKICKKALITRRPKVSVNLPSIYHDYVICEDSRPSLTIIRIDFKK